MPARAEFSSHSSGILTGALTEDPNDQTALYQEIMARRRMGDTEEVRALTAKLNALRSENARREQATDRYRLEDDVSQRLRRDGLAGPK
jgi:hypothetical protein